MNKFQDLWTLLKSQKYWCLLFLIYLTAWIIPFRWMENFWQYHYSLLAAQPFILPGFLLILWGRRHFITTAWAKINRTEKRNPKKNSSGSLTLLIIGCVLYFFAHFSRLALAGILGLVLILLGIIVRVYSRKSLRPLVAPILFLLAIVPWLPESFVGQFEKLFQRISILLIQQIFIRVGNNVIISGDALVINNGTIPLPFGISGSQGFFSAILIFWGYGLYHLYNASKIIYQILVGCVVTLAIYLVRFIIICYFSSGKPNIAIIFANTNSWIITIIGISISFLLIKYLPPFRTPSWVKKIANKVEIASNTIQRPVDKVITKSVTAGTALGGFINVIFRPLFWAIDKTTPLFAKVGQWMSRTNRNLDSRMRKADRVRAQRKKKENR
ncbi:archaeosortase/exosortase family protein [Armatimonas sp.]|uniref:archaeosortase/exosortase family protein n=1 Tax=Armatimonas sp. TaxID=1872638 RepID=UPI00286D31AE|nr:archaeosortase/exosortase family protein [Armatimonas sp.]